MNKAGFMLIEVLLAAAIASLISAALFVAVAQINRSTTIIVTRTNLEERALLVTGQLMRDLTGACVPRYPEKKESSAAKTAATAQAQGEPKKEPQPWTKIFYGTKQEEELALLTFITNNPLLMYWSAQAGKAKPALARVVYRLEQEKTKLPPKKVSYVLMRQEAYKLDMAAFAQDAQEPIRAYALVRGIKHLKVEYGVFKPKSDGDKSGTGVVFTTSSTWDVEKSDKKKKEDSPIPHEVAITLELWDEQYDRSKKVECRIPILPDFTITSTQQSSPQQPAKAPAAPQVPAVNPQRPAFPLALLRPGGVRA
ncbi:MAG TPA: hypothetical protein VLG71_02660 [Candidatus Limnocylindria bacterium]|nr:hypothetical protein [Candidatus Limnocylindria bacterium]